ncbi:TIGR00282 family metallophosphoesterase [Spirochaeta lutea]|uniref:Metallophosphoesterase n=1 Tax=Spirochaeta lutea TaxID=1480694 RepID=A0A098QVN7_9SPIO|nr:TIGR00282 family metallophosphoesterase [Spirochaeta lutea]KGE71885.1 hypothetical protein DC28_08675 [Spirochaeta lutea]
MGLRILALGEIVGKPGIYVVKTALQRFKEEQGIDGVIANADGATHGYGLGRNHSIYLRKLGIDVLTGGDQIYFKKDLHPHMEQAPYILRPANFPPGNPGRGWRTFTFGEYRIAVISLMGLAGFNRVHPSNPFSFLPEILRRINQDVHATFLDFHSCTTAEKAAMALMADGQVTMIAGTGMRTLTADAEVLPKGTGSILDTGRTGSIQSVKGFKPEIEIQQLVGGIPERSYEWWQGLELQGAIFELDDSGKAVSVEAVRVPVETPAEQLQPEEDSQGDSTAS